MEYPLSLLLDVSALDRPGRDRGIGRYVRQLRSAVHDISDLHVTEYAGRNSTVSARWVEWTELPHRARAIHRHDGIYHASSVYHLVPSALRRSVVSILDIIPLDLPEYQRTGVKARAFFSQARWCQGVVVLSEHTAQRITSVLGVREDRIIVCPMPVRAVDVVTVDSVGLESICALPETFVSSVIDVRAVDPRKRLPWLLKAASILQKSGVPLVLVGSGTEMIQADNVIGLGPLDDSELQEVLGKSTCFLYASAYEGQGLPPQESLSTGTPVVAFRNSSLPEMLGPGALWVEEPVDRSLDPDTVLADRENCAGRLVAAVLRFVEDPKLRDSMGSAGRAFVETFTEARFVDTMENLYEKARHA